MPKPELRLVREVDAYQQTLTVDIHDYQGFKVRVKAYDGKSPMPSLFQLLPGGASVDACGPLFSQTVAELRKEGWSETLSAEAEARITNRIGAARALEEARKADLARRLAAFPVSKQDRALAAAIKKPASVRELDLRADGAERLTVIPPSVKALKALEVLHAEGNGLPEIPEELEKAKELRELHLAGNALTDVPPGVRTLKKLARLDLLGNSVTRLFWKPNAMARYELGGNPLLPAVQGSFTRSAIGYLPKLAYLGIDTDCLLPLDPTQLDTDFPGIRTFPTETLVLYGRAPTDAERAQLKKYFPKAKLELRANIDVRALSTVEAAAPVPSRKDAEAPKGKPQPKPAPAAKPRKRGPMHPEQTAHLAELTALAKKAKLAVKVLTTVARPCAELFTKKPSAAAAKLGRSRLGGSPDLPDGVDWPTGERGPMQFVGQLDLAELAPYDPKRLLPDAGLLVFFAGHYDEGRVIHCAPGSKLTPRAQPKGAKLGAFDARVSPACALSLRGGVSLPARNDDVDADAWHELVVAHVRENKAGASPHRVLAHTSGDVDDPPNDDHVLFAVCSDSNTTVEWGDYGTLYFMMSEEALRAQRWDELALCSTD